MIAPSKTQAARPNDVPRAEKPPRIAMDRRSVKSDAAYTGAAERTEKCPAKRLRRKAVNFFTFVGTCSKCG